MSDHELKLADSISAVGLLGSLFFHFAVFLARIIIKLQAFLRDGDDG